MECMHCGGELTYDEPKKEFSCEHCDSKFSKEEYEQYLQNKDRVIKDTVNECREWKRRLDAQEKAKSDRIIAEENLKVKEQEAEIERKNTLANATAEAIKIQARKSPGVDIVGMTENMKEAFWGADVKSSLNLANSILEHDADNLTAKFVVGFGDMVLNKKFSKLDSFMSGLPGVRIDNETIGELIAYMKAVYPRVMPYENQVLSFLYNNRQTPVQTREYVDSISPNFIAKRADHSFMTGEMAETYRKLAAYCSIPKTCYALIGAIQNNPESPLKNGKYYAKTINRKFYDEYILKVQAIVSEMENESYRIKFSDGLSKLVQEYKSATKI